MPNMEALALPQEFGRILLSLCPNGAALTSMVLRGPLYLGPKLG